MTLAAFRSTTLGQFGAGILQTQELLAYNHNAFSLKRPLSPPNFPLAPEPHIGAWERYVAEAAHMGTYEALKKQLVQLHFPIQTQISQSDDYRSATLKGTPVYTLKTATGLHLQQPEGLRLVIHPSIAGPIPVLIPGCRNDFVVLVQALSMRNEPLPVPDSMGACTVAGYNNWGRIQTLRQEWETAQPRPQTKTSWQEEFRRLIPQKELYQDRFLIVSQGPYSNVSAAQLGLSEDAWHDLSFTLRLAHECAHYFTYRLFGAMANNAIDELIADYTGIVAAAGKFRVDWFLHFMGLEAFPNYRDGGRLQNYLGQPPLSADAFKVLQGLVKSAAEHLDQFSLTYSETLEHPAEFGSLLMALTSLTLEELASEQAETRLYQAWHAIRNSQ